jgi:hypothetical protein
MKSIERASENVIKSVNTARCNPLAISRIEEPQAIPRKMFPRSASVSVDSERRATGAI